MCIGVHWVVLGWVCWDERGESIGMCWAVLGGLFVTLKLGEPEKEKEDITFLRQL